MSEFFSPLDRLSSLLRWVRGFPQQTRFEAIGAKLSDPSPFQRIRYCSQALLAGALPDAETLQFVAIAFDKYACAGGALSLDEAFALKSKQKAGNPAAQFESDNRINDLLFDMAMMRAHDPHITIARAAEIALQGDESIPVETLERKYSDRGRKWERGMRGK